MDWKIQTNCDCCVWVVAVYFFFFSALFAVDLCLDVNIVREFIACMWVGPGRSLNQQLVPTLNTMGPGQGSWAQRVSFRWWSATFLSEATGNPKACWRKNVAWGHVSVAIFADKTKNRRVMVVQTLHVGQLPSFMSLSVQSLTESGLQALVMVQLPTDVSGYLGRHHHVHMSAYIQRGLWSPCWCSEAENTNPVQLDQVNFLSKEDYVLKANEAFIEIF